MYSGRKKNKNAKPLISYLVECFSWETSFNAKQTLNVSIVRVNGIVGWCGRVGQGWGAD